METILLINNFSNLHLRHFLIFNFVHKFSFFNGNPTDLWQYSISNNIQRSKKKLYILYRIDLNKNRKINNKGNQILVLGYYRANRIASVAQWNQILWRLGQKSDRFLCTICKWENLLTIKGPKCMLLSNFCLEIKFHISNINLK